MFKLSEHERKVFTDFVKAIDRNAFEVEIDSGVDAERYMTLFQLALGAHYNPIYDPSQISITSKAGKTKVFFKSMFSEKEQQKRKEDFFRKVDGILAREIKSHYSDWEKLKSIFHYLTHKISYKDTGMMSFSGWGAVMHETAVCQGISYAFSALCQRMDIPCAVIIGKSETYSGRIGQHAWNIVQMPSSYYHVDATWCLMKDSGELCQYDYFMLSDVEIQKNHFWNQGIFPRCNAYKYNYFLMTEMYAVSKLMCRRIMDREIKLNQHHIYFKMDAKSDDQPDEGELVELFIETMDKNNKIWRHYHYHFDEKLLIFSLRYD